MRKIIVAPLILLFRMCATFTKGAETRLLLLVFASERFLSQNCAICLGDLSELVDGHNRVEALELLLLWEVLLDHRGARMIQILKAAAVFILKR